MTQDDAAAAKAGGFLAPGDVVSGLDPLELVDIRQVVSFNDKILVDGVGVELRRVVQSPLTAEELLALVKVMVRERGSDGDAELLLLGAGDVEGSAVSNAIFSYSACSGSRKDD